MRDPLRQVLICFSLFVLGLGTTLLTLSAHNRDPNDAINNIASIVGLPVTLVALTRGVLAAFSIRGYNRLRTGMAVIARWHVTAEEWNRFRSEDAVRATEGADLGNVLKMPWRTPRQGVDIVIGPDQILVDGYYYTIEHFVPGGRVVNWLAGDPDCLEFPVSNTTGRGVADWTLRIPVPITARPDGWRVWEHYMSVGPQPLGMIF